MTDPRVGDRVRVSFEAVVLETDADEPSIRVQGDEGWSHRWVHTDAVEVLPHEYGSKRRGIAWGVWVRTYAGWALIDRTGKEGEPPEYSHLMSEAAFSAMTTAPCD